MSFGALPTSAPLPFRIVRVRNVGDKPFNGKFSNQLYTILPDSEAFVPWDAMALWMGNPDVRDVGRNRDRTDLYRRLRVRYGVYEHEDRLVNLPKLEAYDIDGRRITTVLDDPEGKTVTAASASTADQENLRSQVNALSSQLQAVLAMLNEQDQERVGKELATNLGVATGGESQEEGDEDEPGPSDETPAFTSDEPSKVKVG